MRTPEEMKDFYSQFMGPRDVVFDVGANCGNRTEIFSELAGHVVSVEPQLGVLAKLRENCSHRNNISYVGKALGAEKGKLRMMVCTSAGASAISSFSHEWVDGVQKSGRFAGNDPPPVWEEDSVETEVTTLDALIEIYGVPSFIKIDVEGFESKVISGLSRPVKSLSFEMTPLEHRTDAILCLLKLQQIGMARFNYSLEEGLVMHFPLPVFADEIVNNLSQFNDNITFGDIYAWK